MIVAVSRFRVLNGTEDLVRDAFVDRPHLADSTPGFLGMETFTDVADASTFYLVTRWTDATSFHAWHRSEAPHLSHRWIPRGRKLDPTSTRLLLLARVEPDEAAVSGVVANAGPVLADFLTRTQAVYYVLAGAAGNIKACNAALAARLKVAPAELIEQPIWNFLGPNDSAVLRRQLERGATTRSETVLLHFRNVDQAPFSVECRIHPRPDGFLVLAEPAPARERYQVLEEHLYALNNEWTVIARERAQAMRELDAARADAEAANRSKDLLLSAVSHDLRTPLSAMLHGLQALGLAAGTGGDITAILSLLQRSVRYQQRLVDDLLDVGRIASGTLQLRRIRVSLATVVQAAIEELEHPIEEKKIGVQVSIAGDTPDLLGDPDRLRQVVANLLANAVKFTPESGEIRVSVDRVNAHVRLTVADTGVGISPELLPVVFEPFRGGPAGRAESGLGLGLWIAKQIVGLHEGTIEVSSAGAGLGSAFVVVLPTLPAKQGSA